MPIAYGKKIHTEKEKKREQFRKNYKYVAQSNFTKSAHFVTENMPQCVQLVGWFDPVMTNSLSWRQQWHAISDNPWQKNNDLEENLI